VDAEHIRIKTLVEQDFDKVMLYAGGKRIPDEDSADYVLNEAIVELKLISEEGFAKSERQKKLAALFRRIQPNRPVVLINPRQLNSANSRDYYRIVEGPIKNACKKASSQLQVTAARFNPAPVRVLVILNVGYTLLSKDEFRDVCFKCVRNDTRGVDWLLCGGIYFYGDGFDYYMIAPFEILSTNVTSSFPSREILDGAWGRFLDDLMTAAIREPPTASDARMPVIDLTFDLDGIRYVKTAPEMPPSEYWPDGIAPRRNTSDIKNCPKVARTFPLLDETEWKWFRNAMPSVLRLKDTYKEWLNSYSDEKINHDQLKPFVLVELKFEDFERSMKKPKAEWAFSDVAGFAGGEFHKRALLFLEQAKDKEKLSIIPLTYIHLIVNEVGSDKANDFSSMHYVSEVLGFERSDVVVKNARLFFEYGLALAASYAVKLKADAILFTKVRVH
jgi:hypothetical protein